MVGGIIGFIHEERILLDGASIDVSRKTGIFHFMALPFSAETVN